MLEREERISQADAVEDILQLAQALSEAHPDPYTALGGPLAFHRRVAEIASAVPADGMTRSQLLARLRPLVAALRDGHTAIRLPDAPLTPPPGSEKSGLPFEWDTASERVYIAGNTSCFYITNTEGIAQHTDAELTAGTDRVVVRSTRLDALHAAITQDGVRIEQVGPDALRVHGLAVEQVGHLAFAAGVELHELTAQRSDLEELFFMLTEGAYSGQAMPQQFGAPGGAAWSA